MSSTREYFDELYQHSDDPWHLREGWYERRKRSLTLALLPRPRYRNAFEPGCANGELTAELAARCEMLLAADLHETRRASRTRTRGRHAAGSRRTAHGAARMADRSRDRST